MESHSFTCHPTQVSVPRVNLSQTGRYSIYLPLKDGRHELTYVLVIHCIPGWFICPQTVTHQNNTYLTATRLTVEPTTFRSDSLPLCHQPPMVSQHFATPKPKLQLLWFVVGLSYNAFYKSQRLVWFVFAATFAVVVNSIYLGLKNMNRH